MAPKKISANPLPISFKEFAKNPVVGTLFIALAGITYLYVDLRSQFEDQILRQNNKIDLLEKKVDVLSNQLRKSDSLLAGSASKIMVLQELGKIK